MDYKYYSEMGVKPENMKESVEFLDKKI